MYRSLHLDNLIKNEITSFTLKSDSPIRSLVFSFGVIYDFWFENTLIVVTSNLWEFHVFIFGKIWTWLEEDNYELKATIEERLPSLSLRF